MEEELEEEMVHYCPQCWRVLPSDLEICPFCKVLAVAEIAEKTSLFLSLAGVAAVGAAALSAVPAGLVFLMLPLAIGHGELAIVFGLIGLSNLLCTIFGATVAMHAWDRKDLKSTIVMAATLPFVGLLNLMAADLPFKGADELGTPLTLFGVPIIILSLFSLILIVTKQYEFKEREPSKPHKPAELPVKKPKARLVRAARITLSGLVGSHDSRNTNADSSTI